MRPPIWAPYPGGPQERAVLSEAYVTGYGGSAGGGKTDLGLGLAITQHKHTIIFRREYPQLKGIIERSRELLDDHGKFNGQDKIWRLNDGRIIELGACQYAKDVSKYRGRPHDLVVFDEATEFIESQPQFLMGWLRSVEAGQRCRVLMTFNPPTSAAGQWVVRYFAPWLDPAHPNPALPGELRWFVKIDGEDVERPDGELFEHNGEILEPLSRTFFPARLADNPALSRTAYGATLQNLAEPLRSQLLYGDFNIGLSEDAWQVLPTRWVRMAMDRWKERQGDHGPQTCVGADVAHGGKDKTVFAIRHDDWFDTLKKYPGTSTPDGRTAAALCVKYAEPGVLINVDAIGYGASAAERLADKPPEGHGLNAIAINVSSGSKYRDKSGRFKMANLRAEMYWRLREAIDPDNNPTLCLPDDPELLADLTAPTYEITTSGIKIEDKAKIMERLSRSPDCGDAIALAMIPGKRPFEIINL